MFRILVASAMALFLVAPVSGQVETPSANLPQGQGYLFYGVGWKDGTGGASHIGGGGEAFFTGRLGLGVEIGAVWPLSGGEEEGLGSVNVSYHFLRDRKLEPFGILGYAMQFRSGIRQGANIGVGTNLWLRRNLALRLEGRGYILDHWGLGEFRAGVTVR